MISNRTNLIRHLDSPWTLSILAAAVAAALPSPAAAAPEAPEAPRPTEQAEEPPPQRGDDLEVRRDPDASHAVKPAEGADFEPSPDASELSLVRGEREHTSPRAIPVAQDARGAWPAPNRFWTAAETATILTVGGVQYWIDKGGYPRWGLSQWPKRFESGVPMLDTNDFQTNYSYHTVAGAMYHLAARTNDLSVPEAAAWSLGASLAWEYVVEWRGKADINDIIFTTPAGVAAGEFVHRLGRLLHQRREGRAWDVARWSAGFFQTFNDTVAGADSPRGPRIDHDFRLGLGVAGARGRETRGGDTATDDGMISYLRFGGRLDALEDRYAAGKGWRGFRDANFTTADVVIAGGSGERRNTYVLTDAVLAGWRYTDIAEDASRGTALNIGTSTAMRYHRERYGAWREQFGMAHLPGLAIDGEFWGRGFSATALARIHPDYGGVHALGYGDWQAAHPAELGISVVELENYYHAWGASARLAAELAVSRLRAGGSMFLGAYRPHTGLDEFRPGREHHEEGIERGNNTTEQRIRSGMFDYELWLRGDLPWDLFVEARTAVRSRRESFEEFDTRARALQAGLEIGARF
jgi:hypothetical protein